MRLLSTINPALCKRHEFFPPIQKQQKSQIFTIAEETTTRGERSTENSKLLGEARNFRVLFTTFSACR
jgi:hypothetical protein